MALTDTEPKYEEAISIICEQYGSKYTVEAKRNTLGRTAIDSAKSVVTHCNLPITPEQFVELVEEEYLKVFAMPVDFMPGALKLVQHLSAKGIPLAIATSSKNSTFKLKSRGKEEFFKMFNHIVVGSNDAEVKRGKPNPDIFLVAAKRFPNPPSDMKNVRKDE
jgi:pseudouridine-5'-monophosphatase